MQLSVNPGDASTDLDAENAYASSLAVGYKTAPAEFDELPVEN